MNNLKAMKFRVESPEHSEKIQRALFCQGYRWLTNPLTLQHTDATFLHTIFTLSGHGRYIDYAEDEHWFNVDKKDVPEYVLFEGHFVRKDNMATCVEAAEERPPLGLRPKSVVNALRIREVVDAIHRYVYTDKVVPGEWLEELQELNDWVEFKDKAHATN